ncbi:hypothetical protein ACHWUR_00125 [Klebsiella pneumoniae]
MKLKVHILTLLHQLRKHWLHQIKYWLHPQLKDGLLLNAFRAVEAISAASPNSNSPAVAKLRAPAKSAVNNIFVS